MKISRLAEKVNVHASATLELSRILEFRSRFQWSCSPYPFYNCQELYTLMQIKHINPLHLVGVGIKDCKKAKQTKGSRKAVSQAKP